MNPRTQTLARLLLSLFALLTALPAQRDPDDGESEKLRDLRAMRQKAKESGEEQKEAERLEEAEWARLTPEERLARRVVNGSSAHCRFVASCKPEKLLPGQSGVILVTALLQGSSVMPAPAPIEMLPREQTSPVQLGALAVRPAENGRLAPAYHGKPVYDNYAVFEVPVTVGNQAEFGRKLPVNIDLKFDIYDGTSAQPVGRFIERVTTEIEVGKALDPNVVGGVRSSPTEAGNGGPSAPETPSNAQASAPVDSAKIVAGASGELAVEPVPASGPGSVELPPAPPDGAVVPHDAGDSGLPIPLLVGGGAILLVILLLLARKR